MKSYKTVLGYVAVAVVCLVIGFFAGREYLKYEIRSAIQTAADGLQQNFASALDVSSHNEPKRDSNTTVSKPAVPQPVSVTLITKGFRPHDYQSGRIEDAITFTLSFKNRTKKDIRAFGGVVTFSDLLGNKILDLHLAINDPVNAGTTMNWDGYITYNSLDDAQRTLRAAKVRNMNVVFSAKKVLFGDGTSKRFE
ncbi:MAG TPA: hypothetical protein VFK24_00180 [Gammaproteobacteria bacterium]|nr:hypothetical protein [Gammaproteobacteria bacterium]